MTTAPLTELLTPEKLIEIFPKERTNDFFEALFGDASEGAYDIELAYRDKTANQLILELRLHERPNCCLACNLTLGLPEVFSRHPIIDINGIVQKIDTLLGEGGSCGSWSLGRTEQQTSSLHIIPLTIELRS